MNNTNEHITEIGSYDSVIIIDKLFGPTIMANLKIYADATTCEWVIYREWIKTGKWIEWIRIPAQIDEEFDTDNL